MKTRNLQKPLLTFAAFTLLTFTVAAQDSANTASTTAQTTTAAQAAPQLSYGVPQILELSQAKVSDGTIITYIQNGGTIYALNAEQIVYLKQQGVSDAVLNAMLNQRSRLAQTATTTTQSASPQSNSNNTDVQTANAVAQPTVTYVQTVPSTSVYVIPDTQTYDYYAYYYHPYTYYPSYYWYPPVSISFGFGHGFYGGGFHGGYHGGWHGSGGWHGGGGWHH